MLQTIAKNKQKKLAIIAASFCLFGMFLSGLHAVESVFTPDLGKRLFTESSKHGEKDAHLVRSRKLLYWTDHFEKGLQFAKETDKAVLVAFVGTDWCPWSQKLEKEILTAPAFLKAVKEQFVLVWLDFPGDGIFEDQKKLENEHIRQRYDVQQLPMLILVDSNGELISKCGYLPLAPQEFAQRTCNLLNDYALVKDHGSSNISFEALKDLYLKAKKLDNSQLKDLLLKSGVQQGKGAFFLLEKYASMIQKGKIKTSDLRAIRSQILQADPEDCEKTRLKLALLDFQRRAEAPIKNKDTKKTLRPLMSYLKKFGTQDKENQWKVQLMIAQHLFRKGEVGEAIHHAETAFHSAPDENKKDVEPTLIYLKTLHSSDH